MVKKCTKRIALLSYDDISASETIENAVPTSISNVIIPTATNAPEINGISIECNSMTIEEDGNVTIKNGGSLILLHSQ